MCSLNFSIIQSGIPSHETVFQLGTTWYHIVPHFATDFFKLDEKGKNTLN